MKAVVIKTINRECGDGFFQSNSLLTNVWKEDLSWVCDEDRKTILQLWKEWAKNEYGKGPNLDYNLFDFESMYLDLYNDKEYLNEYKNGIPTYDEWCEENDAYFDDYLKEYNQLDDLIDSVVESYADECGYDLTNLHRMSISGYQSGMVNFWEDCCEGLVLRDEEAYEKTKDYVFEDDETMEYFFEELNENTKDVLTKAADKMMKRRGVIDFQYWYRLVA